MTVLPGSRRYLYVPAMILMLTVSNLFPNKSLAQKSEKLSENERGLSISKQALLDKIKGGWAGQTIGVTFGWPTEFVYMGTFIQDYQKIKWHDDYVSEAMRVFPGLFDDIYMDLTFVNTFERLGLNAPADSFANDYAHRGYELWHANQAGRYNVLQGMRAPESGHWLNNPHADDIDFQIEADFAGLMSPAMPNAASDICDRIGHIMNYGDGWYGGVFVANMYAQAFKNDDVKVVVTEALKAIPPQSKFYQCIADVVKWHRKYPDDWKKTWFEIQVKWAEEVGCPDGVFHPLDIDAKLNAAYVVLGLLYGNGDFTKTMELSTRAGQDSDCNPSTAGGVLGTMIGYSKIPDYWLNPIKKAENNHFSFTDLSLNKVYELSFKHALQNIKANGGLVDGEQVSIPKQAVQAVRFEESFAGHYPKSKVPVNQVSGEKIVLHVDGIGFVIRGHVRRKGPRIPDTVIRAALYVDDVKVEEANFPTLATQRRTELFWRYNLTKGRHKVEVRVIDPHPDYEIVVTESLEYGVKPQ
ncbi:ADP-ribosylglycohydrolase family protein [Dyadobacter bucti]|uniref:ADP-ribosylglycohydrolase family protein n=1 Tax=Dyadobacter bucti TaxID=2572203 RepID=UPI001E4F2E34|nr:ADP-ribosylglycohydrolase family protein [Dyadobacter bucti]